MWFGHASWSSGLAKMILQGKEKKRQTEKRGGTTILKNGPEWTLPALLGQLKTRQDEKGLLPSHLQMVP